jgi:hypothetical protein
MLAEANWGNFRAKFNGREQKAFEWLCSLLFYKEHDRPTGALRYFNQPGIEAEPVTVGAEVIGWQAKFIDIELAKYKAKLIDAIDKATAQHLSLTQLYFYLNVDFGRGRKCGAKDPTYKTEIEDYAKAKGVAITWKTASFFETPFVCETNAHIAKHFFALGASVIDFVQDIARHTDAVLEPIRSAITVEGDSIKIDRRPLVARLKDTLSRSALVIVSGEGGVGKTAVIKDFYDEVRGNIPFFVFKATEFNVSHINQFFKEYGGFTFSNFIHEHDDFGEKYVVVDSAERLSDLERPEVFQEFLSSLRRAVWKVIFTTRLSYLEDLKYNFIEIYNAPFEPINIPGLTQQELVALSQAHGFLLPESERLRRILQNPFYLNEYLRIYPKGNGTTSFVEFRESIWNSQIARSAYRKDNIHRKREECFLEIARRRAASGRFYVAVEGYEEALRQLEADEIIKFDSNAQGYFITHDIYEEWALERTIEQAFRATTTTAQFYDRIGDALAIRRAFRAWVSETLAGNEGDAPRLIEATVGDNAIAPHWRDEAIVAALLSNYSGNFVQYFTKQLLERPPERGDRDEPYVSVARLSSHHVYAQSLLYRVIFMLRIACKEVDQSLLGILEKRQRDQLRLSSFVTQPKGSGWDTVIAFLAQHKEEVGLIYMQFVLPLLDDWTRHNKRGETTKAAGELALYYLQEVTKDGEFPYSSRSEFGEQLIRVILNSSWEIKDGLGAIFQEVIAQKDISHRSRFHELVTTALSSVDKSAVVAESLPKEVIGLASVLWPYTPPERDGWGSGYRNDIEQYFDLAPDHFDYYPASALQTPVLRLFDAAPRETVDFVLAFTNKSIEYFARTEMGEREVEEVDVYLTSSGPLLKQYISHRLWMMYRGGQPAPTLLESIHMALEHWLLAAAKYASAEVLESWCLYLIKHSRSASISAIVASVALSEPSKLFNVAQVLFRTKDFFYFDLARMQFDMTARSLYSIGDDSGGPFQDERLRTCDDKHRGGSLETLALYYQLFRSESEGEELAKKRQETIWAILDEHYARLRSEAEADENEDDKSWRLSLARMDRRKMTISSETTEGKVLFTFNPEIDPGLREYSESSLAKTSESMRFSPLHLWGRYRWEGKSSEYSRYAQYEGDPKRAMSDTRVVYDGLKGEQTDDGGFRLMYRSVPPSVCAVLLRDFPETLDRQDLEFCRDVLFDYASRPFRGNYDYQIGDGLDAAIGALPMLLSSFPECRTDVKKILLLTLFDRHPVGMNDRFFNYAVSPILSSLWKTNPEDANALFLGYLQLRPKFENVCQSILMEGRETQAYQFAYFEAVRRFVAEYESELSHVVRNEIAYAELPPIGELDIETLVTAFLLLPLGTKDQQHKAFAIQVASAMAKKSRRESRRGDGERLDFGTRHRFMQKYAHFVLASDRFDIPDYVQPLIDRFKTIEHAEDVFQEFVSAEDTLSRYDSFWMVWELFYPSIVDFCRTGGYPPAVIQNYLLAWPYWRKGAREWHSLKEREKGFFARVARDIGNHPAVLYSLAKLLNEIGAPFAADGVFWISGILESHPTLSDEDFEASTAYYLENLIRGYVLRNREKARTTPQIKAAVLRILNFLLEKGSVTAYLTREYIL